MIEESPIPASKTCLHLNFRAQVDVARLTASDTSETVIGYSADVTIHCAECKLPFEFIGLPMGMMPSQPMCSVDGLEARMPIKPQGVAMRTDLIGFSVRRLA